MAGVSIDTLSSEYVAGFFDGEGCIRVLGGDKTGYVGLHLFITNTYRPILERLKTKYGGSVLLRSKSTAKHKTCYQWRLSSKAEIKYFILDTIEYSIEKKPQLQLGLQYCDLPTLTVNRYSKHYNEVLELQGIRKQIAVELKQLKRQTL